jgi:hypothetical protein
MRRIFGIGMVLLVSSVLMAGPSFAQIGFGIKAGLNIADLNDLKAIDTIDELEQESKTGLWVGSISSSHWVSLGFRLKACILSRVPRGIRTMA